MSAIKMFEGRSIPRLLGTIGFMFFIYLNLLCGGVITIAAVATLIRLLITHV